MRPPTATDSTNFALSSNFSDTAVRKVSSDFEPVFSKNQNALLEPDAYCSKYINSLVGSKENY